MFVTPKQGVRSSILTKTPLSLTQSGRRSLQSTPRSTPRAEEILEEGDHYVVKTLNCPVPVQVQEALRTGNKVSGLKLHESGWAWLVSGAKLLVWRYSTNLLSTKCHHITLPPSGSGWNSELVTITLGGESKVSFMGCSHEGTVCWWSDILRSSSVTSQNSIDVGEGHVFSIRNLNGGSCVIATSLANLWVVSTHQNPQSDLSVRQLALPQSVFSGLGRRVSSLFFRPHESEIQEIKRTAVHSDVQSGESTVFVLTNSNLQKWKITDTTDELVSDLNVMPMVKDSVMVAGWVDPTSDPTIWLIDMQMCMGQVAVLFAVSQEQVAEHGVALFSVRSSSSLVQLIKLNHKVSVTDISFLTSFTLHCTNSLPSVLMLSKSAALLANVDDESFSSKMIAFPQPNSILGTGQLPDQLLLFTLTNGVVSISSTVQNSAMTPDSSRHTSSSRLSVMTTPITRHNTTSSQIAISLVAEETASKSADILENSFSLYLEGDIAGAASLCDKHFPISSFLGGVDTPGDLATVVLSHLILNDPPPSVDPDLSEGPGQKSIIILYRLQQKIDAHTKYIQFLCEVGLIDRVTCVHRQHANILPTGVMLCEHGELLQAALTLRKIQDNVVDGVINTLTHNQPPSLSSHSRNDQFYTNLSKFREFFPALVQYQRKIMESLDESQDKVTLLLSASTLLDSVLRSALFYRQSKGSLYKPNVASRRDILHNYSHWTATDEMRENIAEQLDMLFHIGVKEIKEDQDHDLPTLWANVASLMDILFDGYKTELDSLKSSSPSDRQDEVKRNFEAHRNQFLNLLLNHGQLSPACELAERYEDFRILVDLCQGMGNIAKLKEYINIFSEQGFSNFLFKQYFDEGKLEELLSFSEDFPTELRTFIEPHPSLSWLHYIATQDYSNAQSALKLLADEENKYVARKKTLLSLSKLSLLASHSSEITKKAQLHHVNTLLKHIEVQEELPQDVVEAAGIEYELMPPFSPQKIIEFYVGDLNPESDEKQFLLALDYLNFSSDSLDDTTSEELRNFIWTQAILKDDWTILSVDNPLAELQKTFFFIIVDEIFHQGLDVLQLLPDYSSLLEYPALIETGLHHDITFQKLMKAGYEQVTKVATRSSER